MRAIQRLADIDIAEPRDHALIKAAPPSGWSSCWRRSAPTSLHRIHCRRARAETFQQRLIVECPAGDDLHVTEAARIVEDNGRATTCEHHMIVRAILSSRVVNCPERSFHRP